jgi:hypothetical protein
MIVKSPLYVLKQKAKVSKKSSGRSHRNELDSLARDGGFRDFKSLSWQHGKDPYHHRVMEVCIGLSSLDEILDIPEVEQSVLDCIQFDKAREIADTNAVSFTLSIEEVTQRRWREDVLGAELEFHFQYAGEPDSARKSSWPARFEGVAKGLFCLRDNVWFISDLDQDNEVRTPTGFQIVEWFDALSRSEK